MTKHKSRNILVTLIVLAIIGVVFYYGVIQTSYGGATILSISNAKFVSKSTDLNYNDAFLLDVVVNKGGESLVGEITPDMITQYGIKYIPSGSFKIYFNLKDVSCNYNVVDDGKTFYKVYQATARSGRLDQGADIPWSEVDLNSVKSNCKGTWSSPRGTETASPGAPIAGGDCNAIEDIQTTTIRPELGQQTGEWSYAMLADSSNDGIHWRTTHIAGIPWFKGYKIETVATPKFKVEIIVENSKGEKQTTTLDETQTVQFLGDIGRVKWVGNLLAQEYCGQPAIEKNILKNVATNNFQVVKRTNYEHYQDKLTELVNYDNNYYAFQYIAPQPPRDPGVGADVLWSLMSTLNAEHRLLNGQNIQDNCKLDNMIYSCTPTKDIIYPQLQLILRADWVGVNIPSGSPTIKSINSPEKTIYNGDVNLLKVVLKNDGSEEDSFDLALTCNNPISLGVTRTTIGAGETKEIYINFQGDTGSYICNVKAMSVNNPLLFSIKNFSLVIKEKPITKPESCSNIPAQPCDKALWQAYPICAWNTQFCGEKETNYWIYIIIGIIIVIVGIIIYAKRRK